MLSFKVRLMLRILKIEGVDSHIMTRCLPGETIPVCLFNAGVYRVADNSLHSVAYLEFWPVRAVLPFRSDLWVVVNRN